MVCQQKSDFSPVLMSYPQLWASYPQFLSEIADCFIVLYPPYLGSENDIGFKKKGPPG
jgi:hypothetical protein